MKCIEENTERLDLLEKSLLLEEKQKNRLREIDFKKKEEIDASTTMDLYAGNSNTSLLDEEEAIRKELVEFMAKNSSTPMAPVVRNLTNLQGNSIYIYFFFKLSIFTFSK